VIDRARIRALAALELQTVVLFQRVQHIFAVRAELDHRYTLSSLDTDFSVLYTSNQIRALKTDLGWRFYIETTYSGVK